MRRGGDGVYGRRLGKLLKYGLFVDHPAFGAGKPTR